MVSISPVSLVSVPTMFVYARTNGSCISNWSGHRD